MRGPEIQPTHDEINFGLRVFFFETFKSVMTMISSTLTVGVLIYKRFNALIKARMDRTFNGPATQNYLVHGPVHHLEGSEAELYTIDLHTLAVNIYLRCTLDTGIYSMKQRIL